MLNGYLRTYGKILDMTDDELTAGALLAINEIRRSEGNPTLAEIPKCKESQCGGKSCSVARALNREDCGLTMAWNLQAGSFYARKDEIKLPPVVEVWIQRFILANTSKSPFVVKDEDWTE